VYHESIPSDKVRTCPQCRPLGCVRNKGNGDHSYHSALLFCAHLVLCDPSQDQKVVLSGTGLKSKDVLRPHVLLSVEIFLFWRIGHLKAIRQYYTEPRVFHVRSATTDQLSYAHRATENTGGRHCAESTRSHYFVSTAATQQSPRHQVRI